MSVSSIYLGAKVPAVQAAMDAVVGENMWLANTARWKSLMEARNEFVRGWLINAGISQQALKVMDMRQKRKHTAELETEFMRNFFAYSRDQDWMQAAVGERNDWILIPGICGWMIKWALRALEKDKNAAEESPPDLPDSKSSEAGPSQKPASHSSKPPTTNSSRLAFDPVRDSRSED